MSKLYAEDYTREVYMDETMVGSPSGAFNGSTTTQDLCFNVSVQVGSWTINEPMLIPTCILAAFIGIYCGNKISKANVAGSAAYKYSFYMFACMMTDAMINDSLMPKGETILAHITSIIDGGLTSCVGLSFGFNALFDLGVMKASRRSSLIMVASYLMLIGAWAYGVLSPTANKEKTFMILYLGVILVSCGLYGIITLIHVIRSKGVGLKYLMVGCLAGAVGIASVFYFPLMNFWCRIFGPMFSGMFWWFILSDVAMYYLYKYFMESHVNASRPSSTYVQYKESDSEDEDSDMDSDEEVTVQLLPRQISHRLEPVQQQQPIYYMPVPYYTTTPTYYAPQVTHIYQ